MSAKPFTTRVLELQFAETEASSLPNEPMRVRLLNEKEDGSLNVCSSDGIEFTCDWLENSNNANVELEIGDWLLCIPPTDQQSGIVLGRIGKYKKPQPQERVTIEASESLTLKCGEASVELRNDGRAMVKGEDVLLRAKGTQRIRAASVAIN